MRTLKFKGIKQVISDYMFLAGDNRRSLPVFGVLMLGQSLLEVFGLGAVGAYVVFITQHEVGGSKLREMTDFIYSSTVSPETLVLIISIGLVVIYLLKAATAVWIQFKLVELSNKVTSDLRVRLMSHYQRQPYLRHISRTTPEYIRSVDKFVQRYGNSLTHLMTMISECLVAVFILTTLLVLNPVVSGSLIAMGLVFFVLFERIFKVRNKAWGAQANAAELMVIQGISDGIRANKELRILGTQSHFLEKVRKGTKEHLRNNAKLSVLATLPRNILQVGLVVGVTLIVFEAISSARNLPTETYPYLAMLLVGAVKIIPIISYLIVGISAVRFVDSTVTQLARDLSDEVRREACTEVVGSSGWFRKLELKEVGFQYPASSAEKEILASVNLIISRGEYVGISGISGSGKTTLLDIIVGLLPPTKGKVLVNDHDVSAVIQQWHRQIAYIPQDAIVVDGSILENVALGVRPESVNYDKVISSLEKAQLLPFVESKSEGVEWRVGEGGVRLSGGQHQRLVFARAFYFDRDVMILDEATNSLDAQTEEAINGWLRSLKGSITVIVISHQESGLAFCDRVLEVRNGRVQPR